MNPHLQQSATPGAMLTGLWGQRHMLKIMAWRDIQGRYRGSVMGILWSFITPLLMLGIYTFVFTVVFQARWDMDVEQGRSTFAIVLFIGLIIHGLIAEVLGRAPTIMLTHANYVKKVVFPLQVLPLVTCISALFHFIISTGVLLLAMLLLGFPWQVTMLLFPLTVLPLFPLLLGLAWLLAAIGVYLRDIGHVTGLATTILLFVSPIFFPVDALGQPFQSLMLLNPLTLIIEQSRRVMLWGQLPDFSALSLYALFACVVCWLGFYCFQRARAGFADVL